MRFFRRFLFFIYSGEICVFVRPFRFLLMNASFKNGRTFRFADYKSLILQEIRSPMRHSI